MVVVFLIFFLIFLLFFYSYIIISFQAEYMGVDWVQYAKQKWNMNKWGEILFAIGMVSMKGWKIDINTLQVKKHIYFSMYGCK